MGKALLLSIKPEFAEKIFNGEKSIELRKCSPSVSPGDMVVIYCTFPVKAVIGVCQIGEILKMKPSNMWSINHACLGIDRKRFDEYYKYMESAIGIVLTSASRLKTIIPLDIIRAEFPQFQPPQTFRYFHKSKLLKTYLEHQRRQ